MKVPATYTIIEGIYGCMGCVLAGRCEELECECVGNQIYTEVGNG